MAAIRPTRPPQDFVSITQPNWLQFCGLLGQNPMQLTVRVDGRCIGWRAPRMWYVDPDAYRTVMQRWPDGYWPG